MHTLYMDIMIKRPEIIHDLHARLLYGVHQMQTDDAALAISFPDWKGTPGEFGLLFRVFATTQQLLESYRSHVGKLAERDLIRFFPILPVPATDKMVCFGRDQSHEKFGKAAARRRERRGGTKEPFTAITPKQITHWLHIQSSSGHEFRLVIRKFSDSRLGGHQYGLGLLVPDF